MTIGDVLGVTFALAGVCLTAWALILCMNLLFPGRVRRTHDIVLRQPWKCIGIGLLLTATLGFVFFALSVNPMPLVKLSGTIGLMSLLGLAAQGAAGVAFIVAARIRTMDASLSEFKAFGSGASIIVLACLVPGLGWFLFAPLTLFASLGAGTLSLFQKEEVREPDFQV